MIVAAIGLAETSQKLAASGIPVAKCLLQGFPFSVHPQPCSDTTVASEMIGPAEARWAYSAIPKFVDPLSAVSLKSRAQSGASSDSKKQD